jgi:hypothetical protein
MSALDLCRAALARGVLVKNARGYSFNGRTFSFCTINRLIATGEAEAFFERAFRPYRIAEKVRARARRSKNHVARGAHR